MPSSPTAAEPLALPARDWLERLRGLLQALNPTALALLANVSTERDPIWSPHLPAKAVVQLATEDFDPAHAAGWLIPLRVPERRPHVLYLGTNERDAAEPAVILGVALCRIAWRLHLPTALPRLNYAPQLRDAVHSLRNDLNSMLMNASVLGNASLPPALQPIRTELGSAAERSMKSLHELMVLVGSD